MCRKILTAKQSNLVDYTDTEIEHLNLGADDEYSSWIADCVRDLVCVLSTQGHSGVSLGIALAAFDKVARFKPLTKITGEDDEWFEPNHGIIQNKRLFTVFKHEDGKCFDIYNKDDAPITFPYMPE